jgi:predicted nucleic acid-binding protein
MMTLLDTNVLLRIVETESSRHAAAIGAARALGETRLLVTVPQVAYEFWAVATRTITANGLGMTTDDGDRSLNELIGLFPLLRDERGVFLRWRKLVRQHAVTGVNSYDARIVAAMQRHGITEILTFNGSDFHRYEGITVLTPETVLSTTSES